MYVIQFGTLSSGPPAGKPLIMITFLTPNNPASSIVLSVMSLCDLPNSPGSKGFPEQFNAQSVMFRFSSACENSFLFSTALEQTAYLLILGKMLLALVLGGIIGLERELKHKPVGVKTCAIIAVTTCVLTIVSIQAAEHYAQVSDNIRTDPMRLAAQVISGIGFLGAGVILHKKNDAISGLTTAAIIWAAAAIGVATGAGFIFDAIIATLMILIAIRISPIVQRYVRRKTYKKRTRLAIQLSSANGISKVTDLLLKHDYRIENISVKDQASGEVRLQVRCYNIDNEMLKDVYTLLKTEDEVLSVDVEN